MHCGPLTLTRVGGGAVAAFADMAMVDRFEKGRPTQLIRTGDQLRIEPDAGRVTILNRD